jgi:hypothetical protein
LIKKGGGEEIQKIKTPKVPFTRSDQQVAVSSVAVISHINLKSIPSIVHDISISYIVPLELLVRVILPFFFFFFFVFFFFFFFYTTTAAITAMQQC